MNCDVLFDETYVYTNSSTMVYVLISQAISFTPIYTKIVHVQRALSFNVSVAPPPTKINNDDMFISHGNEHMELFTMP
jgi:hypothetical protein